MGTTTYQLCFEYKKEKIKQNGGIKLINEDKNIIKKCKSNRININIRKSYKNNKTGNFNKLFYADI